MTFCPDDSFVQRAALQLKLPSPTTRMVWVSRYGMSEFDFLAFFFGAGATGGGRSGICGAPTTRRAFAVRLSNCCSHASLALLPLLPLPFFVLPITEDFDKHAVWALLVG